MDLRLRENARFVLEVLFTCTQPFEYSASPVSRWHESSPEGTSEFPEDAMATPNPPASTDAGEHLLTPGEVASLFRVDPKTVTRWASAGRIGSIRTPGGHRRFRESEVRSMLASLTSEATLTPTIR
jgi:excisionase family DNA binding protein